MALWQKRTISDYKETQRILVMKVKKLFSVHYKVFLPIGICFIGMIWSILQIPVVQDYFFDLKTKQVNYDVILHSRGMNYYLGQELSEQEVGGFWRAMQCMTDDTISDDAGIPWSIGYSTREKSEGIIYIGLREREAPEELFQIVKLTLGNNFELYGIKEGTEWEEAEKILKQRGFKGKQVGYENLDGYWKGGIRIILDKQEGKIFWIRLYIYNRKEYEAIMKVIKQKRRLRKNG